MEEYELNSTEKSYLILFHATKNRKMVKFYSVTREQCFNIKFDIEKHQ